MAFIEGHPDEKTKAGFSKYLFLAIIVALMLVFLSAGTMDQWKEKLLSILVTLSLVLMIIAVVTVKVNPMGWMKIFCRSKFERLLKADQIIFDVLGKLDDSHFIFYDFNFELLHVEMLVICPKGIFVVGKIASTEALRVQDKILFTGKRPLMKKTGTLWRICHLINMVIAKGYKSEIMPQPILVVPYAESVAVREFDGISIVTADELNAVIESRAADAVPQALVEGFAVYIRKRYA